MAPMLATAGPVPVGQGWAHEFKWDSVRAIVRVDPRGGGVKVLSRSGHIMTGTYPELTGLAEQLAVPVPLDGELVVLDEHGRPSFALHQHRMHVRAPSPGLLREVPAQFYAFDLLHHAGEPLLDQPYEQRRAVLAGLADRVAGGPMRIPANYLDVPGGQLLEVARDHGLEGVVAKRVHSRYTPGVVSRHWVKTAIRVTQEVVVGGWHTYAKNCNECTTTAGDRAASCGDEGSRRGG